MPKECKVDGCSGLVVGWGYCSKHYACWRRTGDPVAKSKVKHQCTVSGCDRISVARGLCGLHYGRFRKHGSVEVDDLRSELNGLAKKYPREHRSWRSMKARCLNPNNPQFFRYGGNGIKIYHRWLGPEGFKFFLEDMGERPEGTTLDRIRGNGDYAPGNCRWATLTKQNNNRANVPYIDFNGDKRSIPEWAEAFGLSKGGVAQRLSKGASLDTLFKPMRITKK